jgi:hypothetical protein
MARRRPPLSPPVPPPPPPPADDFPPDGLEILGGEGHVRVYRLSEKNGRRELVATMERADVNGKVEIIGERWGWGDYVLTAIDADGTYAGQYRISFSRDGYPRPSERPAADGAGAVGGVVEKLLARLEAMEAKEGGAGDRVLALIMELNKSHQESMATVMSAAIGNKSQLDPLTMLTQVSAIIEKLGPKAAESLSPDALMALIERGMGIGEKLAGAGSGGGGFDMKELIGLVVPAILRRGAAAAAPSGAARPVPPVISAPAVPPANPPVTEPAAPEAPHSNGGDPSVAEIKADPTYQHYARKLMRLARSGLSPQVSADAIFAMVAPEDLAAFEAFLLPHANEGRDVVEVCAHYEPDARTCAEWLRSTWAAVQAKLRAEGVDEPAPEPEPEPAAPAAA